MYRILYENIRFGSMPVCDHPHENFDCGQEDCVGRTMIRKDETQEYFACGCYGYNNDQKSCNCCRGFTKNCLSCTNRGEKIGAVCKCISNKTTFICRSNHEHSLEDANKCLTCLETNKITPFTEECEYEPKNDDCEYTDGKCVNIYHNHHVCINDEHHHDCECINNEIKVCNKLHYHIDKRCTQCGDKCHCDEDAIRDYEDGEEDEYADKQEKIDNFVNNFVNNTYDCNAYLYTLIGKYDDLTILDLQNAKNILKKLRDAEGNFNYSFDLKLPEDTLFDDEDIKTIENKITNKIYSIIKKKYCYEKKRNPENYLSIKVDNIWL